MRQRDGETEQAHLLQALLPTSKLFTLSTGKVEANINVQGDVVLSAVPDDTGATRPGPQQFGRSSEATITSLLRAPPTP